MGDIVNLNQYRKRRRKAEEEDRARQNRQRCGRTKAQKQFERREQEKDRRFLELNRLEQKGDHAGNRLEQSKDT